MPSLRPDKHTFALVLSSPAHLPGELESRHFLLTHAWPHFDSPYHDFDQNSRYSRNFFALTFREKELSPEQERQSNPPYYMFIGDYFAVFLSLYFGKRFDNLGFHLDHGLYRLPDLQPTRARKSYGALPFTSKPRKDLAVPLQLDGAVTLVPILDKIFGDVTRDVGRPTSLPDDFVLAFTAGRFYQQALRLYDSDPEFAFLSLVNAGEVLVSGLEFEDQELYDDDLQRLLAQIESTTGKTATEKLKKRLFQVRRKFTRGLIRLLNPAFFAGSESVQEFYRLTAQNIEKHLRAAYDLRSRFLHAGTTFGTWVSLGHQGSEISLGTPAYGDEDWKKLIAAAPTLAGLERVVRFSLLRFVHQRMTPIHTSLN